MTSYLATAVLVCCIAQFLMPLTSPEHGANAENADDARPVDKTLGENDDASEVGGTPSSPDGDKETASVNTSRPSDDTDVFLPEDDETVGMDSPDAPPLYILRTVNSGESNAVIGVYDADGTLLSTLETPVVALPLSDRALLEVGIEVSGDEDLNTLIEDFGG